MRKIFSIFVAVTLAFTVIGCGRPEEVVVKLSRDSTVGIRTGQRLRVELEANATTGYIWELSGDLEGGELRQIGKYRYVHKSRRIGAGGTQVYRFEGQKKGQVQLVFEYKRPWEKDVKPVKRYVVRVFIH